MTSCFSSSQIQIATLEAYNFVCDKWLIVLQTNHEKLFFNDVMR